MKKQDKIIGKVLKDKDLRKFLIQFIHCDERKKRGYCGGCECEVDAIIESVVRTTLGKLSKKKNEKRK